ncbi:MAG: metalloregulator ArsR/SmtB family transcription factor, partial [Candidatus Nanopelagicales bacterium]
AVSMVVNTFVGVKMAKSAGTIGKTLPVDDITACCSTGLAQPMSRDEAERLAHVLKAVADPARLQLLSLIRSNGEACACDLYEPLGLSQPTVSHHLKVLTEAGLIHREQRGTWAWFTINPARLRDLRELFTH